MIYRKPEFFSGFFEFNISTCTVAAERLEPCFVAWLNNQDISSLFDF